jgi:methionyl-tRNA formyltransferase
VTVAPRLTREDGRVVWATLSAVQVDRMVRALQPWPGVVAPIDGVDVQIQSGGAESVDSVATPGSVAAREGESVVIATRQGGYRVDTITPPGKRAMTPAAWLRGRHSVGAGG